MVTQPQEQRSMEARLWLRTTPLPHLVRLVVDWQGQQGRTKARKRRTKIKTRRGQTLWLISLAVLARVWAASWRKTWVDWWQERTLELEVQSWRVERRRRARLGWGRAARIARLQPTPLRILGKAPPLQVASVSMEQEAVWAAVVEAVLRARPTNTVQMSRSASVSCDLPCKVRGSLSLPVFSLPATGSHSKRRWSSTTWQMQRSVLGPSKNSSVVMLKGRVSLMAFILLRRSWLVVQSWVIGLMRPRRSWQIACHLLLTNSNRLLWAPLCTLVLDPFPGPPS